MPGEGAESGESGPAAPETLAVYARIRSGEGESDISVNPSQRGSVRARNLEFHLDDAWGPQATQAELYEVVGRNLVDRVINGFNAAVLAYGQTGSGKTFTMLGPEGAKLDGSNEGLGIVPRACMQLFSNLPQGHTVSVSYIEVYNDGVNDMLAKDKEKATFLTLREVKPGHVEPEGLEWVPAKNAGEVMAAVGRGDKNRVVAAMAMNPRSSRGHGIITVEVLTPEGQSHGRLTLVDLAGMESSKKSPPEGASAVAARKQEAKTINISLLALSSVVSALASKGAMRIPFRNSKLTRLLQSSLAGNCKAAFVVTLRSEMKNTEEAIGTLRFAQRAKSVEATVIKNEDARKPKESGVANKKLAEELALAKDSLADFESKLATAETYKANLMAEVHTLLGEMHTLQRESEEAKRNPKVSATAASSTGAAYTGYVQALEKRIVRLEEENRILRQRDIMHRLIELEDTSGDGGGGAAPKQSSAAASGAKPELRLSFTKKNLATFDPIAPSAGFETTVQKADGSVAHKGQARNTQTNASKRWSIGRSAAFLVGSYLSSKQTKAGRVHPVSDSERSSKSSRTSKRDLFASMDADIATIAAAKRIQQMWRDKMARDEEYWEMMGYY